MKNLMLVFVVAFAFCSTAMASDVAISTQISWIGQAAADREAQEIADNVTGADVQIFSASQEAALASWVQDHTGDGTPDILILFGRFPASIYPGGNAQPDGSIAELFLDDGNCIINTADWMFYVSATNNGAAGLQNMMDVPAADMGGAGENIQQTVTAEGQLYTPSLVTLATDRPFHLDTFAGTDWEVELLLAQDASGNLVDPVIVHNTVTDGRIGIFYQTNGQDDDPRGEVISEWINNWFIPLVSSGNPFARSPSPKNGAMHTETWASMSWIAGDFAASHDVYFGDNFDDVNDGTGDTFQGNQDVDSLYFVVGFAGYAYPDGLVNGNTYYWRIDEVNDADPNSPWKGKVWSFWIPSKKAYEPVPGDGSKFTDAENLALSWTPGLGAALHTVYFGDDFDTVANATDGVPQGVTNFSPGPLESDKTYFWRVDEFEALGTHTGDVWSFRTLPDIPITDPNLIGWWKLDEGTGTTVVDWSGHGNHGTLQGNPEWVSGTDGGALDLDGSGDYADFRDTSDLPAGTSARTMCGWAKTNSIAGGWRWIAAYGSAGTGLAMFIGINGADLYGGGYGDDVLQSGFWEVDVWHHISLTYDGTMARLYADGIQVASEVKTWDLGLGRAHIGRQVNDIAEFWNGLVDDVRIYNRVLTPDEIRQVMRGDTTRAWNASPANGVISDVLRAASLSWSPGDSASQHAVYFGTDRDAVADADTSDTTGVFRGLQAGAGYTPPEGVEWDGGSYFWRIDEHNTDGTVTRGNVWIFFVADYIIVDDIESYSGDNPIWENWLDGIGYGVQGTPGYYPGNGTGSAAGDDTVASTAEENTVHSGGKAMPVWYNNTATAISEIERTLPGQGWTANNLLTLSLWFYGDAANVPGQLYVKVNGVQVLYDGDASNLTKGVWQVWNIDLAEFGDLQNVTKIATGVQGNGATGKLIFDDIRLYALARQLVTPVQPDPAGLVAQYAFEGNANDSIGGHHGTASGGPMYMPGMSGQAISLDGIDAYVVVGSVGISGVQPRTIAGWAKASVLGTPAWVNVFGFTGPSGNNGHFDIELVGDTDTTTLGWYGIHVYGEEFDILPIDMQWHHLAASYDGTTIKWYGDGLLVGSADWALYTPDNVHIGKREDNSNFFPGMVDDVRIYNRVLSDAEMAGLAGMTKPFDKPF